MSYNYAQNLTIQLNTKDVNLLMADNILLPELYRRKKPRRRPIPRSGSGFMKFIVMMFLVLLVSVGLFSFADIGGNIALSIAKNFLSKNYSIGLNAEKITGNPIKGYTLHNFGITDEKSSTDIFSAGFLSVKLNLPAIVTGNLRLSEVSLGGISMDVEKFIESVQKLSLTLPSEDQKVSGTFAASPAYAEGESENKMPDLPIDSVKIADSHFSSQFGNFDVTEITADVKNLDINIDASINTLPLKGHIDMGESAGFTAANRAELYLGSGKIIATGGLNSGKLDLHASAEEFDLKEITALYPAMLKAEDFDGKADFTADISGTMDNPKVSGSIDYLGAKIYGYPVERASANVSYLSNRVSVSNIQASAFNIPVQGEIAAAMRPGEKLSVMVKLDGSEAYLDELDKILGIPDLKPLSGRVSLFSVNISGHVDKLNGLVNFTAPRIAYDGKTLTNIRAQMKLSGSDTANVDGKFNFEGAQGYLSGNVASILTNPRMNLTAKLAGLDIKRIESMIPDGPQYKLGGKITASVTVKGTAANPNVTGALNSPEFSGWGQTIEKPAINFAYSGKTLTLSKTEGTLNGMPVNVSGKISELPSSNPKLDINATITMTPSALKEYVPDIDSYKLKGSINAGVKIQGTANNPSVNLLASSQNLQAMDIITAKGLELTTALNGDLSKLEKISVNMAAKSLTASGITFTGINANVSKNGDSIILGSLNAKSGEGTITGSGNASVSGKSPLNFSFDFKNLALASLASSSGIDVKGNLSGTLKVAGKNDNPSLTFSANVPTLNAAGFSLNNILADIAGDMKNIALKNVRAEVDGAEITAAGNINISPALKVNVNLNGKNVNLAQLLKDYPAMKGKISGVATLAFNVAGNEKSITGKGSLNIPSLVAYGVKLSDIKLPLTYSGNNFASKGGTAKFYGGTLSNTLTFALDTMKFTDEISANAVDVNGLIQDASGGLEGKITGKGKLTFKVTGSAKDKVTYSGNGNFSMGQGAITGFKWLDLFTRIHKSDGLRFASVNAPLTLQTGLFIIKAGAIANAVKNDALYKYAKLSQNGTINFAGKVMTMDFYTESSVNYQLINAIQGGAKGGIDALLKGGVSGFEDSVKAFLSGGLSGAKSNASMGDFRTVTLRIHGRADNLAFSGLKIGESTLKAEEKSDAKTQTKTTQTPSQTVKQKAENVKEQVKQQVINKATELLPDELKKTLNLKTNTGTQTSKPQKQPATQNSQSQNQTQPQSQNQQKQQSIEDRLKEELQKGIQKGLGDLFRR